jgi:hypothetical protein
VSYFYVDLYQIAIPDTEIRLIGSLQPNYFHAKEKAYDDLFSILFIDFDHSLSKKISKLKTKQSELVYVLRKEIVLMTKSFRKS